MPLFLGGQSIFWGEAEKKKNVVVFSGKYFGYVKHFFHSAEKEKSVVHNFLSKIVAILHLVTLY